MAEVLVLYQISNEFHGGVPRHGDNASPAFNAFSMSRKNGITLSTVKQSCRALHQLNPNGSDGYHWRVRIDEKPNTSHSSAGGSGGGGPGVAPAYSWWDVQDENARLPVKEATPSELKRMLSPPKAPSSDGDVVTQEVTKAAKGAMKYMGKAMNAVAGSSSSGGHPHGSDMDDDLHAVRTPVICFKLLDLGKVRRGNGGGGRTARKASAGRPVRRAAPSNASSRAPAARPAQSAPQRRVAPAPISAGAPRIPPHQQRQTQQQQRPAVSKSTPPTADLMGFNSAAPAPAARSHLQHANSMPATASAPTGAKPGETRAEKLKREYAQKQATANRVWDDVDQRWVEGPVKNGEAKASAAPSRSGSTVSNSNGGVDSATSSVKGISLSRNSAVGKSANVQAAVHARVNEMETSQQKAIAELRAREAQKANADAEEDVVRQRLEPKLRAWAEEHGKKKQLRALLANLHTILWEGSGWKQVSLADVLDDSKVKRVYHKASRVVHPDKTGHLDAEKRFVAKRVFDALTQAKVEFDEGKR
eukprot:CAMPEP_0183714550 /NCGR_PEP_ID=MMETSP0737-20130205/9028_1 /TAXON_ID=385413 /ORGANISM="Thalassiosira miniscula, Strain CCMP1093" /LENGTH=531 /DNA_ID=CAMNT_0025943495 /DNA_START=67 /DNA_END=1662 /DNA_ORIENTATION=-